MGKLYRLAFLLLAAFSLSIMAQFVSAAEQLTPKEILDKVDDLFRGKASEGRMTMTIITENWRRTLTTDVWSKGKDRSLIRIIAPRKEKGTTTLRVENDIWNYLPKVKRVIKLPSSMMSASWMGSHFTNDDLVKESRMAEDYTFEKTFEGARDGGEVIEVTCHPRPEAAIVWGKVILTVRAEDFLPVEIKYYDEDMNLARTMTFEDIGPLGDRVIPRLMICRPENKPKERTEVLYENMKFDVDLPESVFSLRNLQR